MDCPNCRKPANEFQYKGRKYIECSATCGTFDATEGESVPVDDVAIEAQPTQDAKAVSIPQPGAACPPTPTPTPGTFCDDDPDQMECSFDIGISDED